MPSISSGAGGGALLANMSFLESMSPTNQSIVMAQSVVSPTTTGELGGVFSFGASPSSPSVWAGGSKAGAGVGGNSTASTLRFDGTALLTLKYVATEAGLRVISQKELQAYKATDAPYTQTLDEFVCLMLILSEAVSLEELLTTLLKTRHRTKGQTLLKLINERAGDQRFVSVSEALKRAMKAQREERMLLMSGIGIDMLEGGGGGGGGVGGRAGIGGKCPNCESFESKLKALRAAHEELERENVGLHEALAQAEDEVDEVTRLYEEKANDCEALKAELASVRAELHRSRSREETNATRLLAADTEVKRLVASQEAQRAANEGDVTQHSTLYLLSPMSFGSSATAPVVDLPGALVYNLPESFRPLGISMDVYLTGTAGNEYLSCRDARGRRSVGWQISVPSSFASSPPSAASTSAVVGVGQPHGTITVPGTLQALAIPLKKWTRVQARIDWVSQVFDMYVNGSLAMGRVPLRDGANQETLMSLRRNVKEETQRRERARRAGDRRGSFATSSSDLSSSPQRSDMRNGAGPAVTHINSMNSNGTSDYANSNWEGKRTLHVPSAATVLLGSPLLVSTVAVLDVYPRHDVAVCYANMNFFSSAADEEDDVRASDDAASLVER